MALGCILLLFESLRVQHEIVQLRRDVRRLQTNALTMTIEIPLITNLHQWLYGNATNGPSFGIDTNHPLVLTNHPFPAKLPQTTIWL